MDERCSNKSGKWGDLNLCICARVNISTRDGLRKTESCFVDSPRPVFLQYLMGDRFSDDLVLELIGIVIGIWENKPPDFKAAT